MSYYAEGYGELYTDKEKNIPDNVIEFAKTKCDNFSYISDGMIYVEYLFESYKEEDVEELCKAIAPYVNGGSIKFRGEDDSQWRFHYVRGKFVEERGVVVFENDKRQRVGVKLIVEDILNNDTFACDIRIIRFEDYQKDASEIKDLWNTWDYGGDVPFDIMNRMIKMANISDDKVLVLMI